MRLRLKLTCLFLLILPIPAPAAVTSNQLETLVTSTAGVPFRQRVEFGVVPIAEQVAGETASTAKHFQRAQLAAQVLNNPDQFVVQFSQAVVVQLPLASTNLVTVNSVPNADVDTSDATIQSNISAVWNFFLSNP